MKKWIIITLLILQSGFGIYIYHQNKIIKNEFCIIVTLIRVATFRIEVQDNLIKSQKDLIKVLKSKKQIRL